MSPDTCIPMTCLKMVSPLPLIFVFVACVVAGAVAALIPFPLLCLRFACPLCLTLLGTSAAALAVRSTLARFLVGAVAATCAAAVMTAVFILGEDLPLEYESIYPVVVYGSVGAMLSFGPVYHVIRVQDKIRRSALGTIRARVARGALLGISQSWFVALALWWFLGYGNHWEPFDVDMRRTACGSPACLVLISSSIVVAGIAAGALAAVRAE
jgi:hypothetical protein